jgi:hypothetical protein
MKNKNKRGYFHAQPRFLWHGFWLIPSFEVMYFCSVKIKIALLWWYWEIDYMSENTARFYRDYGWKFRLDFPIPTILFQRGQDCLSVKLFWLGFFKELRL